MMRLRLLAIGITFGVAIALGITGIVFLTESASARATDELGNRRMVAGLTCLALGVLLLITASIMAFISSRTEEGRQTRA